MAEELPSPLEVDRFISMMTITEKIDKVHFPSPPEVYRFISILGSRYTDEIKFPSPLEVDRFISNLILMMENTKKPVFVPSRGK